MTVNKYILGRKESKSIVREKNSSGMAAKRTLHFGSSIIPEKKRQKLSDQPTQQSYPETLQVQPFDWRTDKLENVVSANDPLLVRCWCKDIEARVHLRGFVCTVYLELPSKAVDERELAWNRPQLDSLKAFLGTDSSLKDCRP